jgi:hypothetical protein
LLVGCDGFCCCIIFRPHLLHELEAIQACFDTLHLSCIGPAQFVLQLLLQVLGTLSGGV